MHHPTTATPCSCRPQAAAPGRDAASTSESARSHLSRHPSARQRDGQRCYAGHVGLQEVLVSGAVLSAVSAALYNGFKVRHIV